ncbi:hypothetical protein [Tessaracoccus sp. G1721]
MSSSQQQPGPVAHPWRGVLIWGGVAALGSVGLIVVQVALFALWPPVHTVGEVFALMVANPVLGLVSMDALYVVNNILVWLFYLGLGAALLPVSRSAAAGIVGLGTLQMAAYLASNPAAEMLVLAGAHSTAGAEERVVLEAAGEALLAGWKGTAFLTYYWLGAAVLFVLVWALRRSADFPPSAAWWALVSGVLMLVPSPFGTVGMVFALASLVPWSVFCVVAGRRLLRLASAREGQVRDAAG